MNLDELERRLRDLYVQHGTNYVQQAADAIVALRERVRELEAAPVNTDLERINAVCDTGQLSDANWRADSAESTCESMRERAERAEQRVRELESAPVAEEVEAMAVVLDAHAGNGGLTPTGHEMCAAMLRSLSRQIAAVRAERDALRALLREALSVLENDVMQRTWASGVRITITINKLRAAMKEPPA